MNPDFLILAGCVIAGGVLGGVRGLQLVASGGYTSSTAMRQLIHGVVVGLVLGLLLSELKNLNLW